MNEIEEIEDFSIEFWGLPPDVNKAKIRLAQESQINIKLKEELD